MANFGGTRSSTLLSFVKRLEELGWHESIVSTAARMVFTRGVFIGGHWDYWYCLISLIEQGGEIRFGRWR